MLHCLSSPIEGHNLTQMVYNTKQHIFFVDDEPKIRKVVGKTLEQLGSEVSCFASAADCLEQLRVQTCDLLITDVKMPEMDGVELLKEVKLLAPWVPVLLLTGYGDIPMAVSVMKAGAVDFIQKPLEKESFLRKVKSILEQNTSPDSYKGKPLTKAEMRVLKLVVAGKVNKETARLLRRSIRTIEEHRSHINRKLDVHNVAELVKRAIRMGLIELPTNLKKANNPMDAENSTPAPTKKPQAPKQSSKKNKINPKP